jgi:hypothetical protein
MSEKKPDQQQTNGGDDAILAMLKRSTSADEIAAAGKVHVPASTLTANAGWQRPVELLRHVESVFQWRDEKLNEPDVFLMVSNLCATEPGPSGPRDVYQGDPIWKYFVFKIAFKTVPCGSDGQEEVFETTERDAKNAAANSFYVECRKFLDQTIFSQDGNRLHLAAQRDSLARKGLNGVTV